MSKDELNIIGGEILQACMEVHKELGPGFLESVYVFSLLKEFEFRGIKAVPNINLPLHYKGHYTGKYYVLDVLIENEVILEAKSVEAIHPLHEAQLISYLKLTDKRLGYLVNFNVVRIKDGFRRFVNKF
jgi:GxxExxY protein